MQHGIPQAASMHNATHRLIAVDDAEVSYRAVASVGKILGGRRDLRGCGSDPGPPRSCHARGVLNV